MFDARVISVLIASPSDATAERDVITDALHGWNASRACSSNVILLPLRWETGTIPSSGAPQVVINSQLLERADIVFAVFHSRVGQPTTEFLSGTLEEIERADADGKLVHVYFSRAPLPPDVDLQQLAKLREVKDRFARSRLYGEYVDVHELREQVRRAIDHDVQGLPAPMPTPQNQDGVEPQAALTGQLRVHSMDVWSDELQLVVTNHGTAAARDLTVSMAGSDGWEEDGWHVPRLDQHHPVTVPPDQKWVFRFADLPPSIDPYCRVVFEWTERGVTHRDSHSVSFPDRNS